MSFRQPVYCLRRIKIVANNSEVKPTPETIENFFKQETLILTDIFSIFFRTFFLRVFSIYANYSLHSEKFKRFILSVDSFLF